MIEALTGVDKPRNIAEAVWLVMERLQEAGDTLKRLPKDKLDGALRAKEGSWPGYVRDWCAYGAENAREVRIPPSAEAIDRMMEVFDWIVWLAKRVPHGPVQAKVVWLSFGMGMTTQRLTRRLHCDRTTVNRKKKAGTEAIAGRFAVRCPQKAA